MRSCTSQIVPKIELFATASCKHWYRYLVLVLVLVKVLLRKLVKLFLMVLVLVLALYGYGCKNYVPAICTGSSKPNRLSFTTSNKAHVPSVHLTSYILHVLYMEHVGTLKQLKHQGR